MARSRNIKPGFFKNDELAECGAVCMVLFAGLWTISDYKGNLEYRPKRIKVEIIPYFQESIEESIEILEKAKFVYRYSVDGGEYLHICNFSKHQNPHKNERLAGTSIPEPNKDGTKTELIPKNDEAIGLIPDSLNLIPDSLNGDLQSIPFEAFWDVYPRKTNKAKAKASWNRLKPDDALFDKIELNINARLQAGDWSLDDKTVIPHASTYLNNERWEDEVIPRKVNTNERSKPLSAVDRVRLATGQARESEARPSSPSCDGSVVASYD